MTLKIYKKHWDESMELKGNEDWASTQCVVATAFKEQYPDKKLLCVGYTTITTEGHVCYIKDKYQTKVKEMVLHACYDDNAGRKMLPITVELIEFP